MREKQQGKGKQLEKEGKRGKQREKEGSRVKLCKTLRKKLEKKISKKNHGKGKKIKIGVEYIPLSQKHWYRFYV